MFTSGKTTEVNWDLHEENCPAVQGDRYPAQAALTATVNQLYLAFADLFLVFPFADAHVLPLRTRTGALGLFISAI